MVPSPPPSQTNPFDFTTKVSPNILLIFIILAIIFFICSLLHLLVRFLLTPSNRVDPDETDENATAFQGPLQHLFNLHDSGVDQSFIDTLPVFTYREVIGVKDPFDCAVCLCEFDGEDKLRLLPKCSHAFHMDCIDTWLLSHSTCPLCRACLVDDSWMNGSVNCSHVVHVLESGRTDQSSREIGSCSNLSNNGHENLVEVQEKDEKVVLVKLGKFRSVDGGVSEEGIIGNGNSDARRCFSMGSFAYVMDEHSSLQVPIRTPIKKQSSKKPYLPNRMAMSECGCDSRREFSGFEAFRAIGNDQGGSKSIGRSKRESFSVSSGGLMESWRRAFSFRFSMDRNRSGVEELKDANGGSNAWRTISEMEVCRWEDGGSEVGSEAKAAPNSSGKRTLSWLLRST